VAYSHKNEWGDNLKTPELDIVRGTLDLLVLKSLSWEPLHGFGIASAIRRHTDKALLVEEGALYPALYRMESKGWIRAEWGLSENNRRAKFYELTPSGRRHLKTEISTWKAYAEAVAKVIEATQLPAQENA